MAKPKYSAKMLAAVAKVTTRRGKILVEHILKHGSVSTEDLETIYGLTDAASAARDVKDAGVPLAKTTGKRKTGRQMAIYSFGDPSLIRGDRFQGRRAFAKGFKEMLIAKYGARWPNTCLGNNSVCERVAGSREKSMRKSGWLRGVAAANEIGRENEMRPVHPPFSGSPSGARFLAPNPVPRWGDR
jgi:hypothetical protein